MADAAKSSFQGVVDLVFEVPLVKEWLEMNEKEELKEN